MKKRQGLKTRMRILTRYTLAEMTPNYLVGLSFFTVMLLVNEVFRLVKLIVERNIPVGKVAYLFIFTIPYVLALTIPMGVLMASILAFGRLSSDNEITALRASGVPLMRILRPNLIFGVLLCLLALLFFDTILPWGNRQYIKTYQEVTVQDPLADLEARQVIRFQSGQSMRYEREDQATGRMFGIYITAPDGSVTWAESGEFIDKSVTGARLFFRFRLYEVSVQETDPQKPGDLVRTYSPVVVQTFFQEIQQTGETMASPRTMSIGNLWAKVRRDNAVRDPDRRRVAAELERGGRELAALELALARRRVEQPGEFRVAVRAGGQAWQRVRGEILRARGAAGRFLDPAPGTRPQPGMRPQPGLRQAPDRGRPQYHAADRGGPGQRRGPGGPGGPGGPALGSTPATGDTNLAALGRPVLEQRLREAAARREAQLRQAALLDRALNPQDVYELHKKFSLPFACLIFTVIGAPLGMFSQRRGKGMGFGYGIVVMIAYYILLTLGAGWVGPGDMGPGFAAWMPNLFLGVIGVFLVLKKLRE